MGAANRIDDLLRASLMRLLRGHTKLRGIYRDMWPAPPKVRGGVRYLTRNIAVRFTWDHFEFLLAEDKRTRLARSAKYVKISNTHKARWEVKPFLLPSNAYGFAEKLMYSIRSPRDAVRILARIDTIVLWLEARCEGLERANKSVAEAQAPWQEKLDQRQAIHELANELSQAQTS